MEDFSAAGLTKTEAKVYKALLIRKEWLPSELAQTVDETRTNIYKILEHLDDMQLAERIETHKKLRYRAQNPARLLELARARRREYDQAENALEAATHALTHEYITVHEQPGVHFYQGKDGLKNIYQAIAESQTPAYFINTNAGIDFFGFDHMSHLRWLAAHKGVERHALTPDNPYVPQDYKEQDKRAILSRTWLGSRDYTAPVEWGVFDDKLYIVSYGEEATGITVESKQIVTAFKQLYALLKRGQENQPDYQSLPTLVGRHQSNR